MLGRHCTTLQRLNRVWIAKCTHESRRGEDWTVRDQQQQITRNICETSRPVRGCSIGPMKDLPEPSHAAASVWIDLDYRGQMLEAAGQEVVHRLTQACFDDSRALIQRVLPQIAAPLTTFPAAEVMACHRIAGSCVAVGLKTMGEAWYALEQAASLPADTPAVWRSAWERALLATEETARHASALTQAAP